MLLLVVSLGVSAAICAAAVWLLVDSLRHTGKGR